MKKFNILLLMSLVLFLTGCGAKVEPLEDIEISNYELFYEGDGFDIYKLTEISSFQNTICIVLEELKDETCCLGITTPNAYIVRYEEQYISLRNGVELHLFDTYDLMDYGIGFQCNEKR